VTDILSKNIDIAQTKIRDSIPLHRVGMSQIECPVNIQIDGDVFKTPAKVDAYVSLDEPQKGIHMSRLFLEIERQFEASALSTDLLINVAKGFLNSHKGISKSAYIKVSFEYMLKRKALLSNHSGWRTYPVSLWCSLGNDTKVGADVTIEYSSTCPCSAALSRQLIQMQFDREYEGKQTLESRNVRNWLGTEEAIAGTPHGQRSLGIIKTELNSTQIDLKFLTQMIDTLETAVATPVQAAVKREDEQEFARLNAANLMFAEDACRSMHNSLVKLNQFRGVITEARHLESLHAHDAVAIASSGSLEIV